MKVARGVSRECQVGSLGNCRPLVTFAVVVWALGLGGIDPAQAQRLSDDDVRKQMIQESLADYRGSCPCPYNIMRNGKQCGANSAYSKPGGARPLCYPSDISQPMMADYRRRRGL